MVPPLYLAIYVASILPVFFGVVLVCEVMALLKEIQENFQADIQVEVAIHKVLSDLIFNWDQTAPCIMPAIRSFQSQNSND